MDEIILLGVSDEQGYREASVENVERLAVAGHSSSLAGFDLWDHGSVFYTSRSGGDQPVSGIATSLLVGG